MSTPKALVTGASSGIGRALSLELARRGHHVIAAARRQDLLDELVAEIAAAGGSAEALVLDVKDGASVERELRALDERVGGVGLVVANAGVTNGVHARALDWSAYDTVIDVNITGAAATLTSLIPKMVERGTGQLVGVSSIAGYRALPGTAAYSASKAFLSTFLEGLRIDLEPLGIHVMDVRPGFVDTPMIRGKYDHRPGVWPPERAAARIADDIAARRRICRFPSGLARSAELSRMVPAGLWGAILRRAAPREHIEGDS